MLSQSGKEALIISSNDHIFASRVFSFARRNEDQAANVLVLAVVVVVVVVAAAAVSALIKKVMPLVLTLFLFLSSYPSTYYETVAAAVQASLQLHLDRQLAIPAGAERRIDLFKGCHSSFYVGR